MTRPAPSARPVGAPPGRAGAGSINRRIPAGLLDSGFTSFATLLTGLYATRYLSSTALGAYALCYSAFLLANVVPSQLVLMPAEVASAAVEPRFRAAILCGSLRLGGVVAAASAALVPLVLLVPSGADLETRVSLAATAAALTAVSPLQDHVRRMLHQAGRSWQAAQVSATQSAVVVSLLAVLGFSGLPAPWVPFGALAAANILSGSLGRWLAARRAPARSPAVPLEWGALVRSGGWLLAASVVLAGAEFGAVAMLTSAASATAAGQAEATRVLAQPVAVLVIGLLAVFNPALMTAARHVDRRGLARAAGGCFAIAAVAAVGWLVLAGVHRPSSPLVRLFPRSYEVPGLLPWTIAEQAAGYASLLFVTVLLAARREKVIAAAAVVHAVTLLAVVAATARTSGPFALVWGTAAGTGIVYALDLTVLWRLFAPTRRRGRGPSRPAVFDRAGADHPVPPRPAPVSAGSVRSSGGRENP
jgi:hypothetical protein